LLGTVLLGWWPTPPPGHTISSRIHWASGGSEWWLTTVYGPSQEVDKPAFLPELQELRQVHTGPWMLPDDFNLIKHVKDKNNNWLNHRLMGQFHSFLDEVALQEVHLIDRLFTWSNERAHIGEN
jgi:hypothetical protein